MTLLENLNLKRVWEICNLLQERIDYLAEEDTYVHLLGYNSEYFIRSFQAFLDYYSFKVDYSLVTDSTIRVYNNDKIPYESYSNNDVSEFPIFLLSYSEKEIHDWIEIEVGKELKKQEVNKLAEKEKLRKQIEQLTKQLNDD